jgi:hypothetical protein
MIKTAVQRRNEQTMKDQLGVIKRTEARGMTVEDKTTGESLDWDSPEERAQLIERVGVTEYNRLLKRHLKKSVVSKVNGYNIRAVFTQFGRLFYVVGTDHAFSTQEEAEAFARSRP